MLLALCRQIAWRSAHAGAREVSHRLPRVPSQAIERELANRTNAHSYFQEIAEKEHRVMHVQLVLKVSHPFVFITVVVNDEPHPHTKV
jgi:hypothetical protein